MSKTEFKYTTAIKKLRRMKSRIKIVPGGTSAGKTFGILPILIDDAIKNDMTEISVVSESVPHLRRGAIKDFLKIMKITNRYIDENWNRSHLKYTFTNGSYIEFFSADDDSKLRGARRNTLYVNECNNIHKEAYIQLAMRTSGDIWLDYNPTGKFWINDVKESDEAEVLVLTYKDNEGLPNNIVNYLESKRELAKTSEYWKNWTRVYLDGLEGRLEGMVYENWEIVDGIPEGAKLLGLGLDFGFTNDPTAVVALYKYNDELIVDEVLYKKGLLNSEIYKHIKHFNCQVVCDSAEPKSIEELRRLGSRTVATKKGKDSVVFGIGLLQEYRLKITKRSKNIINELNNYLWKVSKTGEVTNQPIDDYNHALDALRYLVVMKLNKGKIDHKITFVNL